MRKSLQHSRFLSDQTRICDHRPPQSILCPTRCAQRQVPEYKTKCNERVGRCQHMTSLSPYATICICLMTTGMYKCIILLFLPALHLSVATSRTLQPATPPSPPPCCPSDSPSTHLAPSPPHLLPSLLSFKMPSLDWHRSALGLHGPPWTKPSSSTCPFLMKVVF